MHDPSVNQEQQEASLTSDPAKPDIGGLWGQVRPDFKYSIFLGADNTGTKLADIFVVNAGDSISIGNASFAGAKGTGTEYWFYSNVSTTVGKIESEPSLYMEVTALATTYPNYNVSDPNVTMKEGASDKGPWGTAKTYSANGNFTVTTNFFTLSRFALELVVGTEGTTKFLYGIQWYQPSSSATNTIGGSDVQGTWTRNIDFNSNGRVAKASM